MMHLSPRCLWPLSEMRAQMLPPVQIGRIAMLHTINNVRSSLNDRLEQSAASIRASADQLEPGRKRNALIVKAREVDFAIKINTWLSASELKSPT